MKKKELVYSENTDWVRPGIQRLAACVRLTYAVVFILFDQERAEETRVYASSCSRLSPLFLWTGGGGGSGQLQGSSRAGPAGLPAEDKCAELIQLEEKQCMCACVCVP